MKVKLEKKLSEKLWLIDCAFLGILAVFGIYLIRGIFAPGFFYNYDLSQHFTESVYVATVLLPKYHQLVGWNPFLYLGWPQGQYNPPASYFIYSMLYYLLSGPLSSLTIYKIMLAGFFVLPGFSLYFATRWFGLSRISAFLAGFIALGTAGGFEVGGPLDITYYGMYEFAAAVALIPLILSIYHRSFRKRSWSLLTLVAVLVSFDFMLHTLAGVFTLAVLVIYTIEELLRTGVFRARIKRIAPMKTLLKFGIIVVVVFGLCAFWIVPVIATRSFIESQRVLIGELGNYATTYNDLHLGYIFGEESTPLILNVLHPGHLTISSMIYSPRQFVLQTNTLMFYQFLLGLAALGGLLALLRSESRFPAIVIISVIGLFLFVSLGPKYYEFLWKLPMFQMLVTRPARAAAVARIFLAIFAGAGLGEVFFVLSGLLNKVLSRRRAVLRSTLKVIAIGIIIFFGITLAVNSYVLMSHLPLATTTSDLPTGQYVPQLFSWLSQNVPNSSRVAYEEYQTDDQHLLAATPIETGLQEIGSGYEFWWQGADNSSNLETVLSDGWTLYYSGGDLYQTLAGLNAEYVVVWGPLSTSQDSQQSYNTTNTTHPGVTWSYEPESSVTVEALSEDTGNFSLLDQIGPFYVFQLKNFTPSYVSIVNGSGVASVTSFQPENIQIHLDDVTAGSQLLVRISYFASWVAYSSSGARLPVSPVNDSLPLDSAEYMSIALPAGGTYNVTLSYNEMSYDTAGTVISWVSLISLCFAFIVVETRYNARSSTSRYLIPVMETVSSSFRQFRKVITERTKAGS